jgi:hypothetical protein
MVLGCGASEKIREVVGEVNVIAAGSLLSVISSRCSGEVEGGVGYRRI